MPRIRTPEVRAAAIAAGLLALLVAGCAGGGIGSGSDLVIVRNETDPYNLEAAQRTADQQCVARGAGRAQFVILENSPRSQGGQGGGGSAGGPPDIIFRCTPAAAQAPR